MDEKPKVLTKDIMNLRKKGYTQAEIAQEVGLSPSAISQRITRYQRRQRKERLESKGPQNERSEIISKETIRESWKLIDKIGEWMQKLGYKKESKEDDDEKNTAKES